MQARRSVLGLLALLPAGPVLASLGKAQPHDGFDIPICRNGDILLIDDLGNNRMEPETEYLGRLGLMEGHLLIARRLLEANQPRHARPHFGHPLREIYNDIESQIAEHNVAPFKTDLDTLDKLVARTQRADAAFTAAWDTTLAKLHAAKQAVPATLRDRPRFMLDHMLLMVQASVTDYGVSIERGRITNTIEYHDAVGFLIYAAQVAEAQKARGGPTEPVWADIVPIVEEIRVRAFSNLLPPQRPAATSTWVRGRVSAINDIAKRVPA